MNTQTLETPRDSNTDNGTDTAVAGVPAAGASQRTRPAHPPSPLERAALRLGLALIVWSRRSYRPGPDREELIRRHRNGVARREREDRQLRSRLLNLVER